MWSLHLHSCVPLLYAKIFSRAKCVELLLLLNLIVVVDPGGFDTPNLCAKSTEHTRAALLSVCVDYTHVVYSAFLACIIDEN